VVAGGWSGWAGSDVGIGGALCPGQKVADNNIDTISRPTNTK
jgi:hypothetical protein